jgi:iron complex outermembrane receptor protein
VKNPTPRLLLFLLSFFIALNSHGQEEEKPPAEEILFTEVNVVTAAKKPQKRSEAPAAVMVITPEEIKNSGARTIAEAVQYKTGLNVVSQSGINIRGVGSGSRILLLVDGARANDVFTGGFEDGFERALTQVERIEVIKGPASSLYGTNAFAGIINIITKKPQDNTGWALKAAGGNFATQNYELLAGLEREKVDGLFTFSVYTDEGSDLLGENDSLRAYDSFGKLEWRDFVFSGGYRHNRQEIPSIGFTLTPDSFIERDDGYGHLHYDKTLSDR